MSRFPYDSLKLSKAVTKAEHEWFADKIEEDIKAGLDTTKYTKISWDNIRRLMVDEKIAAYVDSNAKHDPNVLCHAEKLPANACAKISLSVDDLDREIEITYGRLTYAGSIFVDEDDLDFCIRSFKSSTITPLVETAATKTVQKAKGAEKGASGRPRDMFSLNQLKRIVSEYVKLNNYAKYHIDHDFREHIYEEFRKLRHAKKTSWGDDHALREARKIFRDSDYVKHPNNSK
ncbi:MAG: hypothetical protein ACLP4V_34465 [Methylocella sp.]